MHASAGFCEDCGLSDRLAGFFRFDSTFSNMVEIYDEEEGEPNLLDPFDPPDPFAPFALLDPIELPELPPKKWTGMRGAGTTSLHYEHVGGLLPQVCFSRFSPW